MHAPDAWLPNLMNPGGRMTRRAFALILAVAGIAGAPAILHLWHGGLRLPVPEQVVLIQAALAATMLVMALVQRLRDIGVPGGLALTALLPGAGLLVLVLALVWPGRRGPTRYGLDPRGWIL